MVELCGSTIPKKTWFLNYGLPWLLHGSTVVWLPWFSFYSNRGNLGMVKFYG